VCATWTALSASCIGTEAGNPVVAVDATKITLLAETPDRGTLSGEPGAVSPGGASLRYIDLEGLGSFEMLTTLEDGSFTAAITGDATHTFRLRAIEDGVRSLPVDLAGRALGGITAGRRCIEVTLDLDFGIAAAGATVDRTVHLRNGCGDPVTVESAALRLGSTAFEILGDVTGIMPVGAERDLAARFLAGAAGTYEDIVVVRTDQGIYATTLTAEAR
jgi:hypothetical protein